MSGDRTRSGWLIRMALRAFPASIRVRRAAEMAAVHATRRAEVRRRRGALAAWWFGVREAWGFVHSGLRSRRTPDLSQSMSFRDLVDSLLVDLRFAGRTLRRSPGFAAIGVAVLGIGIGASVAIFSVVDAAMFRPLPLREPERLVAMWEDNVERGWVRGQVAPANYLDWRERLETIEDVAGYSDFLTGVIVGGASEPVRVQASAVTGNFFDVLGVEPLLGRGLTFEESWAGQERVVVVSERLWRTAWGADPGIVGRTIDVDREPVRVVGVMPGWFRFPREETDIWSSVEWDPGAVTQVWFRRAHWLRVVGRLADGVDEAGARAELTALMAQLEREYPGTNVGMLGGLGPLRSYLVGETRTPMLALTGAVALLLLLACVNIANLLLVRAAGRAREIAVRGSLGAMPRRIARQLLTETGVLALAAGVVGIGLGALGTRLLIRYMPPEVETMEPVSVDPRVLAFAVLITATSAAIFGLFPAWRASRADAAQVLKDGGRAAPGRASLRTGSALVIVEIALAVVLVVGAGLLARSIHALGRVDPGIEARGVLSVAVSIPPAGYQHRDQVLGFQSTFLERVRALPGVTAAGATSSLPLIARGWSSDVSAAGWDADRVAREVRHSEITPGYLDALGIPVLHGRSFNETDVAQSMRVVVINQAMAKRHFPNEDPIGRRVTFNAQPDSTSIWYTIVGVVGDVSQFGLREPARPEIFAPTTQDWNRTLVFLIRSDGEPLRPLAGVRAILADMDPGLPLFNVRTMDEVKAVAHARERFVTTLFTGFAGVALLLALVGTYGVAAQAARRRTHEFGIRMALGARRSDVQRMVLVRATGWIAVGVALGIVAATLGTRLLSGLLFGVPPVDALTFGAVAVLLTLAGVVACWLPARRATRADPVAALRGD